MKISKIELVIAAITIAFFAFAMGHFCAQGNMGDVFTVSTQRSESEVLETETIVATEGLPVQPNATPSASAVSELINLNTADVGQLESLPGIGAVLAQRIVDYRSRNGGFKTIFEITNVKGVGDKTFEKIEIFITVG